LSKSVKIGASIAITVVAVVLYVVQARNAPNDISSRTDFHAVLECLACGHEFDAHLGVDDLPPYACAKCGKREAWFVWKCGKCGGRFCPKPSGDPPRQPMIPTCTKCGGPGAGRVTPPA